MANEEAPKAPPPGAEGSLNRAQTEFQRHVKRQQAQPPGGAPAFMMPVGFFPGGEAMPGWAVPPSVATLPHAPGTAGFFVPMMPGGMSAQGSLIQQLGSTIHLGVDVINAALASGIRLLNGIAGAARGEYECGQEGCGCEACRGSRGGCGCCGSDCCGACESCCGPSVGTCC
jgi:hypothetical protein